MQHKHGMNACACCCNQTLQLGPRFSDACVPLLLQFVAFFSVAFVAYFMRTRHGYRSLPEAIHARYGGFAALAFGLAVAYRYVLAASFAMQLQLELCMHGVGALLPLHLVWRWHAGERTPSAHLLARPSRSHAAPTSLV